MMSELPNSWQPVILEQICNVLMGQSPESSAYNDEAKGLPFFQGKAEFGRLYPTVRKWCTEPKKIAEKGDILLSIRAPVGPSNIASERCIIGRGLAAIRVIDPVHQNYIFHLIRQLEPWLSQQGTGSTFKAVSGEFVRAIEVPLAPVNEQKRIADKLDTVLAKVDACRDRLDSIPVIIKRFRQSVLAVATKGILTEDWRNSNPNKTVDFVPKDQTITERELFGNGKKFKPLRSFYEEPSEEIPDTWRWCSIEEATLKITDGTHHSPASFDSGKYMYVTSKNVREGYIDLKGITYVGEDVHKEIYSRCDVKENDVLYVKDGANTGLSCVSTFKEEVSLLSSVGVLRCSSFLMPKFLELILNSPETRRRMLNQMSGNAINRLTLEKIAVSAIPIAPIEEQTEIVRRVESLFAYADRLEARYTTARSQVEQLTPALLAKAFRGELVPQDPNDEPASELLARITAAKPDAPHKKTKK